MTPLDWTDGEDARTAEYRGETKDDRPDDADESLHWLCACGHFITDGLHCPTCGAEPPWGCDCGEHDGVDEEGFDFNEETI